MFFKKNQFNGDYSAFFSPSLVKDQPIEQGFAWWEELLLYFLPRCNHFCVECYSDNEAGLTSCAKFGAQNLATRIADGRIESWAGAVEKPIINELVQDPFCIKRNTLKWDRLFLRDEDKTIISVAMLGAEISLHRLSQEDLEFVVKLLAPYDISVCYWENAGSGEAVPIQGTLESTLKNKKESKKNNLFDDE